MTTPQVTVVTTHHRMPEARLRDWFAWNGELFAARGWRVIVVSDVPRPDLPEYARAAVYPRPMETFSLAATSNYGVRLACGGSAPTDIIAKIDPDVLIPAAAAETIERVAPRIGWSGVYRMAVSASPAGLASAVRWDASKGAVALAATDWQALTGYDERQAGYGVEDGTLFVRAGKLPGMCMLRHIDHGVFHIAHDASSPQDATTRSDQWNRTTHNPLRRRENKRIHHAPWTPDPWWGIP
jgi:hypothetical protein